jgi:hypothetical protein
MRKSGVSGLLSMLWLLLPAVGCGDFRGIPSHGGGKRFDEEQRLVAGAIRRTLADIDLAELQGKRVLISIECISQDGGGAVTFPGVAGINAGVSGNIGTGSLVQINQTLPIGPRTSNDNDNQNISGHVGMGYNAQTAYSPTVMSTMPDLGYFRAALEMKARHAGLSLVAAEPEAVLYVLIDVLGTNRSRRDSFVTNIEVLQASCECTYYAQDPTSGALIFEARRAGAASAYEETHRFGVTTIDITRRLERATPTSLPVDEKVKPSTQPAIAKANKPWWHLSRLAGAE